LEKVQKKEEKEKTVAAQRLEKEKEKEENRGAFFLGLLPPHALLRSWSKPAGALLFSRSTNACASPAALPPCC
jgi:hypothetical protein